MTQTVSKWDDMIAKALGYAFLIGIVWVIWRSAFGCILANFDYVTKACALSHLQKPSCNEDRDILEVDEVKDTSYSDNKGQRQEVRSVIYEFRKRPVAGPVSDTVMRDTTTLFKLDNGRWVAACENVVSN
jgi:hypothetical protein